MSRQQRYTLAVGFCFFYVLAYLASEFFKVPMFWYYPLEQAWHFSATPAPGLMMGWYGKVLFCLGVGLLGTGVIAAILKLSRREAGPELQGLLDLSTMILVMLTLFQLANSLAHRVI